MHIERNQSGHFSRSSYVSNVGKGRHQPQRYDRNVSEYFNLIQEQGDRRQQVQARLTRRLDKLHEAQRNVKSILSPEVLQLISILLVK